MAAGHYRYAEFMVSHGGKIQRSSQGVQAKYIGGETQLVKVPRSITLREFHDRLAAIAGCFKVAIRYVCPRQKTLDTLRDVVTADDLQQLLDWVHLRDLQIHLPGASPANEIVPQVWVLVDRVDVRPPLPESLFSSAPTTKSKTPPVPPSCGLSKRSASAPSLSADSTDGTSSPPTPCLIQRSASASTLAQPTTSTTATAAAAAGSTRATQGDIVQDAALFPASRRGPASPAAPVFLVPVVPVIVRQPVFRLSQGFLVPAGYCNVLVLSAA
uniref:Uncharacterized protein n=1 Tax=Avena sativa TaxID=4498 RepID=A0ACD5UPA7_AVESA